MTSAYFSAEVTESCLDHIDRLDGKINFIGRTALQEIAQSGPIQRVRGILFAGPPCPLCSTPWSITVGKQLVEGVHVAGVTRHQATDGRTVEEAQGQAL